MLWNDVLHEVLVQAHVRCPSHDTILLFLASNLLHT